MRQKIIVCDLDGTLAPSKSPLEADMAEVIRQVLREYRMAVISGASFAQFEKQFLSHLPASPEELANLYLFPINGAAHYSYEVSGGGGRWKEVYDERLSEEEKRAIFSALEKAVSESGVDVSEPYGKIAEDRGGQITFSGRGQEAPLDVKEAWDPDEGKRKKITTILERLIPQFEVRIGGATSIDITRKGITKAYAIGKIEEYLRVGRENILFIGDALFPGGNDQAVAETGVECYSVSGPKETKALLINILDL